MTNLPQDFPPVTDQSTEAPITLTRAELDAYIRDTVSKALQGQAAEHEKAMAAARARIPVALVPAHSGGPGIDNHRPSWSLAEQEASLRGEDFEHWHD